ncbi:MAG: Helicase associated domain protein [Candidatus Limnocylindrales bacterium]
MAHEGGSEGAMTHGVPQGSGAVDRLLSVTEVALITGRPPEVVTRWARQGLLAATRGADGTYRFPLVSLLALAREDFEGEPLYRQLRLARLRRGLSQGALAQLFGTSQRMVALWERGPQPSGRGTLPGRLIAARYIPLVRRWIETGHVPTADERGSADPWEWGFANLERFVAREGHARVPRDHREGRATLGRWVTRQRTYRANGVLSADRVARLEALPGWSWDPDADAFGQGVTALRAFVAEAGSALVPARYRSADGFALGKWCVRQRTAHRRGLLAPERAALLEALPGWSWQPPRTGRPRVRRR